MCDGPSYLPGQHSQVAVKKPSPALALPFVALEPYSLVIILGLGQRLQGTFARSLWGKDMETWRIFFVSDSSPNPCSKPSPRAPSQAEDAHICADVPEPRSLHCKNGRWKISVVFVSCLYHSRSKDFPFALLAYCFSWAVSLPAQLSSWQHFVTGSHSHNPTHTSQ